MGTVVTIPTPVFYTFDFAQISLGMKSTYFLSSNGTIFVVGDNTVKQRFLIVSLDSWD
jgi:hypothetical protein